MGLEVGGSGPKIQQTLHLDQMMRKEPWLVWFSG